jgi:ketosteroid isomerase-like protein
MKKILFLLCCAITLNANAQKISDRQAILNVLEQQRNDWNVGNVEAYMQGYWKSDSLLFVGKNGPTYGWQKTLENYKKGYPDKATMGYLTFGIKKVELLTKDRAFVLGSWNVKQEKAELKGYFTLLLRKIDGVWKVIVDHSS